MYPLSDKDLDRLSREAAEQYDVDQNTSGWDVLEQKLNKHLPEKGKKDRRRFLFFIWLFALLSGGGLLWVLTGNPSTQMITLKEASVETTLPPSKNESTDKRIVEGKIQDNTNRGDIKSNDQSLPVVGDSETKAQGKPNTTIPEKNTAKTTTTVSNQKFDLNNTNSSGINKNISENNVLLTPKEKKRNNLTDRIAIESSPLPSSIDGADQKDSKKLNDLSDNQPEKEISSPLQNQPLSNESQSIADSSKQLMAEQLKTTADSGSSIKNNAVVKNKSGFNKGLAIGVIAAPDMSNVKFTNTDKIGFNVGVQIGYRVSQRWSVNTGAIYTRKNYTSQGKDFNPAKGSWLDNVKLDMVEGNCFMFDIPLNVRYDLNTNQNHRYYVSTGLSTYLMKKEAYHYYYQYTNGTPGYRYRSFPSKERHWLSIVNISAGFEKKLNKHLSLQAEPYLKIPLAGVGFGNLQLNSYGMYFSLKYSLK